MPKPGSGSATLSAPADAAAGAVDAVLGQFEGKLTIR